MTNVIDFPCSGELLKKAAEAMLPLFYDVDWRPDQHYWVMIPAVPDKAYPVWLRDTVDKIAHNAGHAPNTFWMAHTAAYRVLCDLADGAGYASSLDAMIGIRDIEFDVSVDDALNWIACEENRKYADVGWTSYGHKVGKWDDFVSILSIAVTQWYWEIGDAVIAAIENNWEDSSEDSNA